MSGARSNIVPMMPMPQGQMMSSFPAGCCPPGGMDALLQCYCDVQAATAFISKVVTDLAQNDPAFQKALAEAIAASGSNVPLIGVTNGSQAQPGQVGEFVQIASPISIATGTNTQVITAGVLQPGDWDVWTFGFINVLVTDIQWITTAPTIPAGFSEAVWAAQGTTGSLEGVVPTSGAVQALISVPTLIVYSLQTISPSAGAGTIYTCARRRR